MSKQSWLISWIGRTDLDSAAGALGEAVGPVASALLGNRRYDRVYLLTNYDHGRAKAYCEWLEVRCGYEPSKVDLYSVDLLSPIDYSDIYRKVSDNLHQAGLPNDSADLTFHLSPGTPAMAAIWIILSRTRFPAGLIQSSKERGLESVDFPFDLASDFLPEYLGRSTDRISRLADGTKLIAPEFGRIIHRSPLVERQIELARRIAPHDVPVLILGETGTGKELFAEAIHSASTRASKPFVAVNCGAISPELANSELFGHKRGAFTGAIADRKGCFQEAHGGTLFLDEIGDLPLETQVRLLRTLQAREITPVGASVPVKTDVRILAATHRDLSAEVGAGRFREDLFHRLSVGVIRLPPLRARDGDVALLIDHFIGHINADSVGKPEWQKKEISQDAIRFLVSLSWPGNIRELYHTLLRAAIWSPGAVIGIEDVRLATLDSQAPPPTGGPRPNTGRV